MDMQKAVAEFHALYDVPVGSEPCVLRSDRLSLRLKLIEEEYDELIASSGYARGAHGGLIELQKGEQDIVEMADALGDIVYVCFGMAVELGVDLNRVLAEIHRANLSKLGADGKPIINGVTDGYRGPEPVPNEPGWYRDPDEGFRDDLPIGKVIKGPNYVPPQIALVLAEQ